MKRKRGFFSRVFKSNRGFVREKMDSVSSSLEPWNGDAQVKFERNPNAIAAHKSTRAEPNNPDGPQFSISYHLKGQVKHQLIFINSEGQFCLNANKGSPGFDSINMLKQDIMTTKVLHERVKADPLFHEGMNRQLAEQQLDSDPNEIVFRPCSRQSDTDPSGPQFVASYIVDGKKSHTQICVNQEGQFSFEDNTGKAVVFDNLNDFKAIVVGPEVSQEQSALNTKLLSMKKGFDSLSADLGAESRLIGMQADPNPIKDITRPAATALLSKIKTDLTNASQITPSDLVILRKSSQPGKMAATYLNNDGEVTNALINKKSHEGKTTYEIVGEGENKTYSTLEAVKERLQPDIDVLKQRGVAVGSVTFAKAGIDATAKQTAAQNKTKVAPQQVPSPEEPGHNKRAKI